MTNLSDFGAGATTKPPRVKRKYIEQSPHNGKIAGFLGVEIQRDVRCYTTLRRGYHFYSKGGGYAISDDILSDVDQSATTLIIIHEGTEEDDDVWEFRAADYLGYGEAVPDEDLYDTDDPQTYLPIEEATNHWENHGEALFVREFSDACNAIDWRGYDPDLKDDE